MILSLLKNTTDTTAFEQILDWVKRFASEEV